MEVGSNDMVSFENVIIHLKLYDYTDVAWNV